MNQPNVSDVCEKQKAEEATGCVQRGGLRIYRDPDGEEVDTDEALEILRAGNTVSCSNAGAGSYRELVNMLGGDVEEALQTGSSAGDWAILVKFPDETPRILIQENRYPYCGFSYSLLSEADTAFQLAEMEL